MLHPAYECVGGPWDGQFYVPQPEANLVEITSFDPWTSRTREEGHYYVRDGKLHWKQNDVT